MTTPRRPVPLHRRLAQSVAATAAAALATCVFASAAAAQAFPVKPVRIIIPFPPGNTLDIMTRLAAPKMSERLGQPVIVENMAGASGMIGMSAVARAAPDGYTLGGGQGGTLVVLPHTAKNIQYNALKDFVPVALSTTNYLGIVAYPQAPFKTIQEMVAWAKANPGRLTVATNGEGGFPHLAFEDLRARGGFTFTHIPYKGSAAISTDVMSGQVMAGIDGITGITPHIKSGKLRLLSVTSASRATLWPDTPAAAEAVPGYASGGWFGYIAPAGTPRDIVLKLNEAINAAFRSPDVADKLTNGGLVIVAEPPEHFGKVIQADFEKYGKLVKDIGFQPQ
jgi:tripartite-type tricarboxylate transporter receptor subunit TctC